MAMWILRKSAIYDKEILPHLFTEQDRALVEEVLILFGKEHDVEWIEVGNIRDRQTVLEPEKECLNND